MTHSPECPKLNRRGRSNRFGTRLTRKKKDRVTFPRTVDRSSRRGMPDSWASKERDSRQDRLNAPASRPAMCCTQQATAPRSGIAGQGRRAGPPTTFKNKRRQTAVGKGGATRATPSGCDGERGETDGERPQSSPSEAVPGRRRRGYRGRSSRGPTRWAGW